MKFVCNKEELQKGIGIVIRATYNKFQKSILECIHMKTEDHSLILESFDTVTGIKTKIYADVIQPGESAIPARIFSEIINKFPEGEITFERKGQGISLSLIHIYIVSLIPNSPFKKAALFGQPLSCQDLDLFFFTITLLKGSSPSETVSTLGLSCKVE